MTFIEFYNEYVSSDYKESFKRNVLFPMQRQIENEKERKMFLFAITPEKHLLSSRSAHVDTMVEHLNKGNIVVLASAMTEFKKLMFKQVKEKVSNAYMTTTEGSIFNIIKV